MAPEEIWKRLVSHARGCSITYKQRIKIMALESPDGVWYWGAFLKDSGKRVTGWYQIYA